MQNRDTTPFFSIITPVYNRKQNIQNAINSILQQDFSDWEYLIADDGSTDGTAEVIDQAMAADSRIVSLHLPQNQGVSAARNLGLQHAKGRFILFLDSDDEFKRGAFSFLNRMLSDYPDVDAVIFRVERFGSCVKRDIPVAGENCRVLDYPAIRYPLLAGLLGICPVDNSHIYRTVVFNKCVKRSIFTDNEIQFDVSKITWEDLEISIRVLDACKKIVTTDTALCMDRTSDVSDHLSMKYYSNGAKNTLCEYKWMMQTFGDEFDFHSDYALNWIFGNLQIWLARIMSKDQNRYAVMQEVLTDPLFIEIITSRKPEGFFEKAVCRALKKKRFRRAYQLYWLQNLLNRGECF